jgi:hypothetical protein
LYLMLSNKKLGFSPGKTKTRPAHHALTSLEQPVSGIA